MVQMNAENAAAARFARHEGNREVAQRGPSRVFLDPPPSKAPVMDPRGLIEDSFGPGRSKPGGIVWHVLQYGRACLLYLHNWGAGLETVTTLDTSRPCFDLV